MLSAVPRRAANEFNCVGTIMCVVCHVEHVQWNLHSLDYLSTYVQQWTSDMMMMMGDEFLLEL